MTDKNLVQYKAYIDKESGTIVCNTLSYTLLTGSTIWLGNQIEVQNSPGAILTTPQQIEFFNASPGSNFNIGCAGGNFYIYNANTSLNVLEVDYSNSNVNINNQLSVNTATISTTLTSNNIIANNQVVVNCNSSTFGVEIVGSSTSNSGTQITYMDGTYTAWNIGPNFTGGRGKGVGIYDFLFNNPYLGTNQIVIQHDNAIVAINSTLNVNQSINVTNTLTANNIVATSADITTLTATTINPSPSSISYAGTSGNAYVIQPFTGSGYKKVLLLFSSYVPGAALETFDFPVSFVGEYQVTSNINNLSYTLLSGSIEITNFNTSTTYNNGITIEGW